MQAGDLGNGSMDLTFYIDSSASLIAKLLDKLLHLFFSSIFSSIEACHLGQRHRGNDFGLNRRKFIGFLDSLTSSGTILGLLEYLDNFIGMGRTDDQPFDDVQAFLSLAQVELGAAC